MTEWQLLVTVLVILILDLAVSIYAVYRALQTDRALHVAIKHPARLHGPVK